MTQASGDSGSAVARRDSGAGARALVRGPDRRWVMVEAAKLEEDDVGRIAVTLRAATATETFTLLWRAYALSTRERQVVAALVAGLDTRAITQRLFISPHTVQDHLESVFTKTGARSRRELLARFSGTGDTRRLRSHPDAVSRAAIDGCAERAVLGTAPSGRRVCGAAEICLPRRRRVSPRRTLQLSTVVRRRSRSGCGLMGDGDVGGVPPRLRSGGSARPV